VWIVVNNNGNMIALLSNLHSRRQHFLFGQWNAVDESLHWRFALL